MRLAEIQQIVYETLAEAEGVSIQSREEKKVIYITLQTQGDNQGEGKRRRAEIWTSGVEAFLLDVDGGYNYADFEYDEKNQSALVRRLATLAVEYLRGNYKVVEQVTPRGHIRKNIEITLDGETYRMQQWLNRNPLLTVLRRLGFRR